MNACGKASQDCFVIIMYMGSMCTQARHMVYLAGGTCMHEPCADDGSAAVFSKGAAAYGRPVLEAFMFAMYREGE